MPVNRNYSSVAGAMQLDAQITSGATSITVNTAGGLPSPTPGFTLVLDPDTVNAEIVTCTGVSGTTLTVVRGQDGTGAVAHSAGAVVRHMLSARDLREPQEHIAASAGVHGLAPGDAVVGVVSAATLENKTISGNDNTITDIDGTEINDDSIPVAKLKATDILDADTLQGRKAYVQSGTPSHTGAFGTGIWFKTV